MTDMKTAGAGKEYTKAEWLAEGTRLFGNDARSWRFRCPKCGNVATGKEFEDAGGQPNDIYQKCIGRLVPDKGCDWAAFGLFDICKVHVDGIPVFEFAPEGEK